MSAALDLRSKEEKDAELDKRIEALRKKNEALIKRYQEIEEDRKKAEQEGIAVTALRRVRPPEPKAERRWVDAGTLQVMLSPGEKRVVKDKKTSGPPKPGRGASPRVSGGRAGLRPLRSPRGEPPPDALWEGSGRDSGTAAERGGGGRRLKGRGGAGPGMGGDAGPDQKSKEWEERRRRNIEKMNEEMEKIAEYERNQRDGLHEKNPVRNFLDDPRRSGPFQEVDRKEGSRRHVRNWGGADFDKVKAGMEREKTWQGPGRRSSPKTGGQLDMTLSMTGRERAEYVRWKKEREQIDQERLARHRKPTGQWRREWDAEKSDSMFKEGSAAAPGLDAGGGEETRRFPPKPPTFGEFLTPRRTQRRKKGRGQGAGTKPYSMHDNRWEEKEAPSDEAENQRVEETPSGAPPEPPASLSPEEDEDQWEDVSEEEEEEEDEGGSPGSSSEAEAPRRLSPPELVVPPGGVQSPIEPPQGEEARPNPQREASSEKPAEATGSPAEDGTQGAPLPPCQPDAEAAPGMVEITDFQRVSGGGWNTQCPVTPSITPTRTPSTTSMAMKSLTATAPSWPSTPSSSSWASWATGPSSG
ncbi:coiled-coil domain-containing protein 9-like isoform X4 [Chroicocephalus ridibundus]|uniref:coiled-coil domain-containing protein 9-like isoform X4 n=1 Tax=Chroicocephalus ridibundus TaxID=1192867 RepID=UPI002FDE2F20